MRLTVITQDRLATGQALARLLADSYFLHLKTLGYHWNVRGPMFYTLHNLFKEQYTEIWLALDDIAERIRALELAAPCSHSQFMALTKIREVQHLPNAGGMIEDLLDGHEQLILTAQSVLPVASKCHDEGSVDLVTQRLSAHEKNAWMLRSFLTH